MMPGFRASSICCFGGTVYIPFVTSTSTKTNLVPPPPPPSSSLHPGWLVSLLQSFFANCGTRPSGPTGPRS